VFYALQSMSIWDGINRNRFYHDLDVLYQKDRYQKLPTLSNRLLPHLLADADDESTVLSATIERQLADDFAFLASWTTWPRHVAASAVQQQTHSKRLCISIAANQGINARLRDGFGTIFEL
jgi:hypothetical protein